MRGEMCVGLSARLTAPRVGMAAYPPPNPCDGHNPHYHSGALLARKGRPRGAGAGNRAAKKAVAGVYGMERGEAATARRPRPRAPRPRASAITLITLGCGGCAWPGGRVTRMTLFGRCVAF